MMVPAQRVYGLRFDKNRDLLQVMSDSCQDRRASQLAFSLIASHWLEKGKA
jgi:predicted DNA-binding protein with PD1-like motif